MRISSTANPVVRYAQSLQAARVRRDDGVFLAEGVRLVGEALEAKIRPSIVLFDPESLCRTASGSLLLEALPGSNASLYEVDARVLKAAAQTEHPGGVLAVLPFPESPTLSANFAGVGVVLDGVADPGNAGTILRGADAFGAAFVIAMAGGVDLYAPKVVRAGMGAHFHLPIVTQLDWDDITTDLIGIPRIAAAASRGDSVIGFPWPDRCLIVIGGEAGGLSPEAIGAVDQYLHIPMRPGVESLNAAMAASIMLFSASASSWLAGS